MAENGGGFSWRDGTGRWFPRDKFGRDAVVCILFRDGGTGGVLFFLRGVTGRLLFVSAGREVVGGVFFSEDVVGRLLFEPARDGLYFISACMERLLCFFGAKTGWLHGPEYSTLRTGYIIQRGWVSSITRKLWYLLQQLLALHANSRPTTDGSILSLTVHLLNLNQRKGETRIGSAA